MDPAQQLYNIRSDISDFLGSGLDNLDAERVAEVAQALEELNLKKPSQMVKAIAEQSDPSSRFEQFVKVIQALRQVELRTLRLGTAETGDLVELPMYGGLFLDRSRLPEREMTIGQITSLTDRFAREYLLVEHLKTIDDRTMADQIEFIWGNASLTPLVVNTMVKRPDFALELVMKAMGMDHKIVHYTAMEVCAALGGESAYKEFKKIPVSIPGDKTLSQYKEKIGYSLMTGGRQFYPDRVWLGYYMLKLEALHFRPDLMPTYETIISKVQADNEQNIAGLNASKQADRQKAVNSIGMAGCPVFVPLLRSALTRETTEKVERELLIALACCGDLPMIDDSLRHAQQFEPTPKAYLSSSYGLALAILGDVRAKSVLLEMYRDRNLSDIHLYGSMILPEFMGLIADPRIAKWETTKAVLFRFNQSQVVNNLETMLSGKVGVEQLLGLLHVSEEQYNKDRKIRDEIGALVERAIARMDGEEQKTLIIALSKSPSYTSLITGAWEKLLPEARRESVKLVNALALKTQKEIKKQGKASDGGVLKEARKLVELFRDWDDVQTWSALMKVAIKTPDFFKLIGDKPVVDICRQLMKSEDKKKTILALEALGLLGAKSALSDIRSLDTSDGKIGAAVEQALHKIESSDNKAGKKKGLLSRVLGKK